MKKNKDLGLLIQCILSIGAIIFFIISIFEKAFINGAYILCSLILFVLAYNNQKVYKRKYFTLIYLFFGILLFVGTIISLFK